MENVNYNLVKLLQAKMDNVWRLSKYYINDAKEVQCQSASALEKILEEEKGHIEMLKKEMKKRIEGEVFN